MPNEDKPRLIADWKDVLQTFDTDFPAPRIHAGDGGEVIRTTWIFRGLKSWCHGLEPAIERLPKRSSFRSFGWATIEGLALSEFQSKAPLHIEPSRVPKDKLSWLALMQHYGVPTRLLDFTYSPFVSLYFAMRGRTKEEEQSGGIKICAINVAVLMEESKRVEIAARKEHFEFRQLSNSPDYFASERQDVQSDNDFWQTLTEAALNPTGARRRLFREHGLVCAALPHMQNARLSSQQGVFLLNAAEELPFDESLGRMMSNRREWRREFLIPNSALQTIETKLFQMNIHELSVYPDLEGVAGFIRQKACLHWAPMADASSDAK